MAARRNQGADPLVQELLNETKPGLDEHTARTGRYNQAYTIYRGSPGRPQHLAPWQACIRVKYGMQVIDTATVNIATGKPRFKVLPRTPDYTGSARAFQRVMDYHRDRARIALQIPPLVQQGLIYGITLAKNHWLYKTQTKPVRRWYQDADGNPASRIADAELVTHDGPILEPWDVYDAWWEPNARDVDTAAWIILRSWLSPGDLRANECTVSGEHNPLDCNGLYHNVEELLQTGAGKARTANAQESFLGGDTNLRKGRFELWEIWRDNRLTVLGNRQVLLRDAPNPHWHGRKPVVLATTRPDLFKIQGIPETELVKDLQESLQTLESMRMDNLHLTTARGFTYREGGVTDPNALVIRPRFLWPVTDHDDVKAVEIPPLPPEAYQEERELLQRLQYVTGINDYVAGASPGVTDQNTATGISILSNAAGALLRFKAGQIHYGCLQPTAEMWGSDTQQFMSEAVWVRLEGPGGKVEFQSVNPWEVAGEFDYVIEDAEANLSKQQERQDALALLTAFAPLAQLGIVNWKAIVERVAVAFGFENPEEVVMPAPHPPAPAAPYGNFGSQGGMPPVAANGGGQRLTNGMPLPGLVQNAVTGGY